MLSPAPSVTPTAEVRSITHRDDGRGQVRPYRRIGTYGRYIGSCKCLDAYPPILCVARVVAFTVPVERVGKPVAFRQRHCYRLLLGLCRWGIARGVWCQQDVEVCPVVYRELGIYLVQGIVDGAHRNGQ